MEHSCKWLPCLVILMLGLSQGLFPCKCVTLLTTQVLNTFGTYCLVVRFWIPHITPTYLHRHSLHARSQLWMAGVHISVTPTSPLLVPVASGSIQRASIYSCVCGEDWFVSLSTLEMEPWKPSVTCRCVYHPEGQRGEVILSSGAAHPGPLYGTRPTFTSSLCFGILSLAATSSQVAL